MSYSIRLQFSKTAAEDQRRLRSLVQKIHGTHTPRSLWFLAEEDQPPGGAALPDEDEIGCAFVVLFEDFVTIDYLFVREERRKTSVGRALIEEISRYAASHGKSRLLTSTLGAHESLGFWERCGFKIIGTSRGSVPLQDVYYLERHLSP